MYEVLPKKMFCLAKFFYKMIITKENVCLLIWEVAKSMLSKSCEIKKELFFCFEMLS